MLVNLWLIILLDTWCERMKRTDGRAEIPVLSATGASIETGVGMEIRRREALIRYSFRHYLYVKSRSE